MESKSDDCYFYYYSSCAKGELCPFRHCPAALGNEVTCDLWKEGRCYRENCKYRHMVIQKSRQTIPCYWETQPGGCTKPHCVFMHRNRHQTSPLIEDNRVAELQVADNPAPRVPTELPELDVPRPKVQQIIINPFEEESDQDSIFGGSPMKQSNKQATMRKIEVQKPVPHETPPVVDQHEHQHEAKVEVETSKRKPVPKSLKPEPAKTIVKISSSKSVTDVPALGVKSLEEIRREKALESLMRRRAQNAGEKMEESLSDAEIKTDQSSRRIVVANVDEGLKTKAGVSVRDRLGPKVKASSSLSRLSDRLGMRAEEDEHNLRIEDHRDTRSLRLEASSKNSANTHAHSRKQDIRCRLKGADGDVSSSDSLTDVRHKIKRRHAEDVVVTSKIHKRLGVKLTDPDQLLVVSRSPDPDEMEDWDEDDLQGPLPSRLRQNLSLDEESRYRMEADQEDRFESEDDYNSDPDSPIGRLQSHVTVKSETDKNLLDEVDTAELVKKAKALKKEERRIRREERRARRARREERRARRAARAAAKQQDRDPELDDQSATPRSLVEDLDDVETEREVISKQEVDPREVSRKRPDKRAVAEPDIRTKFLTELKQERARKAKEIEPQGPKIIRQLQVGKEKEKKRNSPEVSLRVKSLAEIRQEKSSRADSTVVTTASSKLQKPASSNSVVDSQPRKKRPRIQLYKPPALKNKEELVGREESEPDKKPLSVKDRLSKPQTTSKSWGDKTFSEIMREKRLQREENVTAAPNGAAEANLVDTTVEVTRSVKDRLKKDRLDVWSNRKNPKTVGWESTTYSEMIRQRQQLREQEERERQSTQKDLRETSSRPTDSSQADPPARTKRSLSPVRITSPLNRGTRNTKLVKLKVTGKSSDETSKQINSLISPVRFDLDGDSAKRFKATTRVKSESPSSGIKRRGSQISERRIDGDTADKKISRDRKPSRLDEEEAADTANLSKRKLSTGKLSTDNMQDVKTPDSNQDNDDSLFDLLDDDDRLDDDIRNLLGDNTRTVSNSSLDLVQDDDALFQEMEKLLQ